MAKRKFGELELAVLTILKSGKKMTVKQVLTILGEENKYTTIMTVMNRLFEKQVLGREKNGLQYVYWLIETPNALPSYVKQFKEKAIGFKTAEMVSYLIEDSSDITDEELEAMEKAIHRAREERNK